MKNISTKEFSIYNFQENIATEGRYIVAPEVTLGPPHNKDFQDWPKVAIESYLSSTKIHSVGLNILWDVFVDDNFLNISKDGNLIEESDILHSFYKSKRYVKYEESPSLDITENAINFLVPNYREYGHFLIEILPRILLLKHIFDRSLPYPLLVPATLPSYIDEYLNYLFKDVKYKIVKDNSNLRVKKLLIPSLLSNNHIFHPFADCLFTNLVKVIPVATRKKIYISRSNFRRSTDFRILSNEAELSNMLISEGFEIVQPEKLSCLEQMAIFFNADFIVGEAGSGLHNSIFSKFGTKIVSINYINGVQNFIARLRGQKIEYVTPTDGILRTPENTAINRIIPREYKVDLEAVKKHIVNI